MQQQVITNVIKSVTVVVLLFIFIPYKNVKGQFVFDDVNNCHYNLDEKKHLTFIQHIWVISSHTKNIYFSPCNDPINITGCDSKASVCIINKQHPEDSITNAGSKFQYFYKNEEKTTEVFETIDGGSCTPTKNYTTRIRFSCSPDMKRTPTLTSDEEIECEFEITVMKPGGCEIPCTTTINENLIDLRNFRSKNITVRAQNSSDTLLISLCGPAIGCGGSDVAGCDITDNYKPIASVSRQHVIYNAVKNELIVRSKFKYDNKSTRVRTLDITLKCKWNIEVGVPVYHAFGGKYYKVEIESKFGCVKPPPSCTVRNVVHYDTYNLHSLYKMQRNWSVLNVTNGKWEMNVCGPMTLGTTWDDQCSSSATATHSQICSTSRDGKKESWGSVFQNINVVSEGVLTLMINYGSPCKLDAKQSLKTSIVFICSFSEMGPVLQNIDQCTAHILWKTPTACPSYIMKSLEKNCYLVDFLGYRNISGIYSIQDRNQTISSTTYLRYNLCGPLKFPCDGHENVSVCINENGKEHIVGFSNNELISTNGLLSLILTGESCRNGNILRQANVNFHCDYSAPKTGLHSVNVVHDSCLYNIEVRTPLACLSQSVKDCRVANETHTFDLSGLNENYLVKDGDIEYYISVCRPILTTANSLCSIANTAVCMKNVTVQNTRERFKSFGLIANPVIENDEIVIYNVRGELCNQDYYSSTIRFRCSQKEGVPILLKTNHCSVEFIWYTKSACPVHSIRHTKSLRSCSLRDAVSKRSLDFSKLHRNRFNIKINQDILFLFDICSENYSECLNESCIPLSLSRHMTYNENERFLKFILNSTCLNQQVEKKYILQLKLECSVSENATYVDDTIDDCVIYVNLKTYLVCNTTKDTTLNKRVMYEKSKTENQIEEKVIYPSTETIFLTDPSTSNKITQAAKNCGVTNFDNAFTFSLSSIQPMILSRQSQYFINFNNLQKCGGYICKNNISMTSIECPEIIYNYSNSFVQLSYKSNRKCNSGYYNSEVLLKCNKTNQDSSLVISEDVCSVTIQFIRKEACVLLLTDTSSTTAAITIGSLSGVLVITVLLSVIYIIKKKNYRCRESVYWNLRNDKNHLHLYCRNAQE